MSTLDGVMLFAQSQPCEMHFMNQRALIARGEGNILEIKAFTVRRGLTHYAERRQSHPPDTDSRLLTEMRYLPTFRTLPFSDNITMAGGVLM